MLSTLSKRVVQQFTKKLQELVPGSAKDASVKLPRGFHCFALPLRPDVSTFLVLLISPKDDEFTLEVAWSTHGRFPFSLSAIYLPFDPENGSLKDSPIDGEFLFRLPFLYPPYADVWWTVDEKSTHEMTMEEILVDDPLAPPPEIAANDLARVDASLETAMSAVKQFAIPYLLKLQEHYPSNFRS
ncbi:hypothetical protein [Blastopirellula retiformator]|uniref:Uncharacterized protein n=1 Tax=Blastopirellula retiformator TaxID=2527970 RepID=A0A5C5V2S8_9BACT|nr:hypothetical protein [Blastopirellula retiformator]TWT32077.1 hypothetical protein Enr8_40030 [Blastopirellula retiformator]